MSKPACDPRGLIARREKNAVPEDAGPHWYYSTIWYEGHLLGLLVAADDEETARIEAEEISADFGYSTKILDLKKVVIQ